MVAIGGAGRAGHHPGTVDRLGDAGAAVAERAEVGHLAAAVEKRVRRSLADVGVADDLAGAVDGLGGTGRAAQGAEVGDGAVAPQDRVGVAAVRQR